MTVKVEFEFAGGWKTCLTLSTFYLDSTANGNECLGSRDFP